MAVIRAALVIFLLALPSFAQTIELRDGTFRVSGWRPDRPVAAEDFSSVFTVHSGGPDSPAILGSYSMDGNVLVFRPRFPLMQGVQYRAVFHRTGAPSIETVFGEKKNTENTAGAEVVRVYPSQDVLPSNQLKLYVHFSVPMSYGEALGHIHWLDKNGQPLPWPFLVSGELWDTEQQQLTLFFEPGRIKRGVQLNEELGPPLREGEEYTLVIDREFLDSNGSPLKETFRRTFRGGPADRTMIDPKKWVITAPKAGTTDPLTVDFREPMDVALAEELLSVAGMSGVATVERNETRWVFKPDQPWRVGNHELKVDLNLEDLAGNRIDRLFDTDITDVTETPVEPAITAEAISILFVIN
jgi:hypothetical protein